MMSRALFGALLLSFVACADPADPVQGGAQPLIAPNQSTALNSTGTSAHETPLIDPDSGLLIAPHWELAKAHCGACHSYRLVTAQRGDRDYWLKTIDWMQRTQNLWQIPEPALTELTDYLAGNYNESEWGRRPPLSPSLLPSD